MCCCCCPLTFFFLWVCWWWWLYLLLFLWFCCDDDDDCGDCGDWMDEEEVAVLVTTVEYDDDNGWWFIVVARREINDRCAEATLSVWPRIIMLILSLFLNFVWGADESRKQRISPLSLQPRNWTSASSFSHSPHLARPHRERDTPPLLFQQNTKTKNKTLFTQPNITTT